MDQFNDAVAIFNQLPAPMQWLALVVIAAKMITPLTPTRHKNPVLDKILQGLNYLALNIAGDRNENADDVFRKL